MRARVRHPEEKTMYMRVTCPVCEGKGTTADPEVPQVAETCDGCGGAGFTAPQPVQAWTYPPPTRLQRAWAWVRYQTVQHSRGVLRAALFIALGVACGMLGAWITHLLLMELMW